MLEGLRSGLISLAEERRVLMLTSETGGDETGRPEDVPSGPIYHILESSQQRNIQLNSNTRQEKAMQCQRQLQEQI